MSYKAAGGEQTNKPEIFLVTTEQSCPGLCWKWSHQRQPAISELWSQLTRQTGSQGTSYTLQMAISPSPPLVFSTEGNVFALLSITIQKRNITVLSGFSISLTNYQVCIGQLNSGISQFFPQVGSCRLYQMLSLSLCKHDPWAFNLCDSSSIPLPVM